MREEEIPSRIRFRSAVQRILTATVLHHTKSTVELAFVIDKRGIKQSQNILLRRNLRKCFPIVCCAMERRESERASRDTCYEQQCVDVEPTWNGLNEKSERITLARHRIFNSKVSDCDSLGSLLFPSSSPNFRILLLLFPTTQPPFSFSIQNGSR